MTYFASIRQEKVLGTSCLNLSWIGVSISGFFSRLDKLREEGGFHFLYAMNLTKKSVVIWVILFFMANQSFFILVKGKLCSMHLSHKATLDYHNKHIGHREKSHICPAHHFCSLKHPGKECSPMTCPWHCAIARPGNNMNPFAIDSSSSLIKFFLSPETLFITLYLSCSPSLTQEKFFLQEGYPLSLDKPPRHHLYFS